MCSEFGYYFAALCYVLTVFGTIEHKYSKIYILWKHIPLLSKFANFECEIP